MITLLFRELVLVVLGLMVIAGLGGHHPHPHARSAALLPAKPNPEAWSERLNRRSAGRLWLAAAPAPCGNGVMTLVRVSRLAGLGVYLFQQAGAEFFPAVDDGRIMVKVRMPAGAALERLDAINAHIEALVRDDPRVRSVFALSGGAVRGLYTNKIGNEGEVDIELVPPAERDLTTTEFIRELRPKVARLHAPGAVLSVDQAKMRGIRTLGQAEIEVEIAAPRSTPCSAWPTRSRGDCASARS